MSRYKYIFTLICGVISISILLGLGTWQLRRLVDKKVLISTINKRYQTSPQMFTDIQNPVEYQHVILKGRLLSEYTFFIEGKPLQGKLGKYFIVPMELEDKRIILVNRGWVPLNYSAVNDQINPLTTIPVIILYSQKPKWIFSTEDDWYWIDCQRAQRWLGKNVLPYYGSAQTNLGDHQIIPLFTIPPTLPNNHLTYAFIWYALAVSLCIVLWYLLRRER